MYRSWQRQTQTGAMTSDVRAVVLQCCREIRVLTALLLLDIFYVAASLIGCLVGSLIGSLIESLAECRESTVCTAYVSYDDEVLVRTGHVGQNPLRQE